jgi:hypothetical protein
MAVSGPTAAAVVVLTDFSASADGLSVASTLATATTITAVDWRR